MTDTESVNALGRKTSPYLLHHYQVFPVDKPDEQARLDAYLNDHAFLIDAILALLDLRWKSDDLAFAVALADRLLEGFEDSERGGFFFTGNDHETLFHRLKHVGDDALPAANAIAARCLQRLGQLLGETRYLEVAEATLRVA